MAKILKHLVFGQKKNPPVPPRPDYEGNQTNNPRFSGPIYCNIPHSGNQQTVHFEQRNKNQLIVFEEYSEPADLRAELEALNDDDCDDPLYSAPVDHDATSPFQHGETKDQEEEEDMYCVPYEHSEENDTAKSASQGVCKESEELEDNYDVVPTLSEEKENASERVAYERSPSTTPADDTRPSGEYDEPWEWTVGARITSSLQSLHVSPSSPGGLSLDTEEHTYSEPAASESFLSDSESIDEDMTTRQRRMYETAFDSRVKRDIDDIDRLMQSPVLQGDLFRPRDAQVVRTASRSSFGSTSGSSNSSTPTHQPMVVHSRQSLRQLPRHFPLHFTPTERRKVTLIRDLSRSSSPQGEQFKVISGIEHSPKGFIAEFKSSSRTDSRVIPNYVNERKLSLTNHWGSNYRCSDRSSSQESMNIMDQRDDLSLLNGCREEHRMFPLGKSASRDSIDDRRYFPNGFAKNSLGRSVGENSPFSAKKAICGHQAIKVLPTENGKILAKARNKVTPTSVDQSPSNATNCSPMETSLSKNDEPECQRVARPCSLATESRLPDKTDQSPQNDDRPSGDYDLPWEFKSRGVFRPSVNGSISVPECLSHPAEVNSRGTNSSTTPPSTAAAAVDSLEDVSSKMPGLQAHSSNDGNVAIVVEDTKSLPTKPAGPPARPSLNLNLNLNSNSPKKARQNLTLNFGCSALSVVGEKVDAGLTLEKQGWYHGSISRLDAENLLRVLKEGSYLVRNSESSKQDYSLSLKSARGFMHMKIVQSDGHYILGQFSKPFSSIPEMIHHYSINKLPIKGAEHMSLLYPVIDQLL